LPRGAAFPRAHANYSRKLAGQFFLVFSIRLTAVIRKEDKFVARCQVTKDVIRTDIAAVMNGQNFVRLGPEDSQPAFLEIPRCRISIIPSASRTHAVET
jgi:hypothetical protein